VQTLSNLRELVSNPSAILSRYRDSGVKVVGYTCSYVPEEIIISAGLQPYRISDIGADASALVPNFVCRFASGVLENMLKFEDFFSAFVIAHTCDPMWRLYDVLKKKTSKPLFFLRVPHDIENELSLNFFEKELIRFKGFFEGNFGIKIDATSLSNSIELCNDNRSLLKSIYLSNSGGRYGINASERFPFVLSSMWMPKQEINAQIRAYDFSDSKAHRNARLHLNGTAIYDLNLIKMIEESGGFLASDDLCTGSRYFWSNVEKSEEPISSLAHRYFKRNPCPSHGPLEDRLEYINLMLREFKAQGLVVLTGQFCDPILYDSVHIRNMLAKARIPTVVIDYENSIQEVARIKTRVEAFMETLGA